MRGLVLLARETARLGEEAGAEVSILLLPAHPNAGTECARLATEEDREGICSLMNPCNLKVFILGWVRTEGMYT